MGYLSISDSMPVSDDKVGFQALRYQKLFDVDGSPELELAAQDSDDDSKPVKLAYELLNEVTEDTINSLRSKIGGLYSFSHYANTKDTIYFKAKIVSIDANFVVLNLFDAVVIERS